MGKEQPSSWYDHEFKRQHGYSASGYESSYSTLFNTVISCLDGGDNIVELGCGTGQLAEMIIDKGYNYIQGVDFSPEGVRIATDRCGGKFVVCDLNDYEIPECNCIVSTEVFEHIINDLKILERIKQGVKVVFSVPEFDYSSHVRHFPFEQDVKDRYGFLFQEYTVNKVGRIFIVRGIR